MSVKRDSATGAPPIRKRDSPADGLAVGAALRRMKSRGRGQGQGGGDWVCGVRELKTKREGDKKREENRGRVKVGE